MAWYDLRDDTFIRKNKIMANFEAMVEGTQPFTGPVYHTLISGTPTPAANLVVLPIADMTIGEIYQVNVVSSAGATWHVFGFAYLRTAGDVETYTTVSGGSWTIVASSAVGIEIASASVSHPALGSILRIR